MNELIYLFFKIVPLFSVVSNHPAHFKTKGMNMSPSAFIPFCDFGGDMATMGVKIDQFDIPVCSGFQAVLLNDQVCYEANLMSISNNDIAKSLESGFAFIMDYNEDRQVIFQKNTKKVEGLVNWIAKSDQDQSAFIYLDTIGKMIMKRDISFYNNNLFSRTS